MGSPWDLQDGIGGPQTATKWHQAGVKKVPTPRGAQEIPLFNSSGRIGSAPFQQSLGALLGPSWRFQDGLGRPRTVPNGPRKHSKKAPRVPHEGSQKAPGSTPLGGGGSVTLRSPLEALLCPLGDPMMALGARETARPTQENSQQVHETWPGKRSGRVRTPICEWCCSPASRARASNAAQNNRNRTRNGTDVRRGTAPVF